MALEQFLKTLVRKPGRAASKAQPFYSPVDQAIASITQNKGTGAQMLAEILKTKGAAKELKDRPAVKKALEQPKITKQELERVAADNPAPQIEETVLGSKGKLLTQDDLDRLEGEARRTRNWTAYENAVQQYEAQQLGRGGEEIGERTKFAQYTIPGGENYREVLIRMPDASNEARENLRQFQNQMKEKYGSLNWRRLAGADDQLEHDRLLAEENKKAYRSSHFDQPNILAHARVSDRVGPNGEKILHIEEIQSDWHQAGRKKGYKTPDVEARLKESENEIKEIAFKLRGINNRMTALSDNDLDEFNRLADERQVLNDRQAILISEANTLSDKLASAIPDAPFKQNWHELVMKRLLDDAARNGYDKVVLTPGAEQAKRYDLSKQVDKVVWHPETGTLAAQRAGGDTGTLKYENVTPDKLADYIGKDAAERLTNAPDNLGWKSIEGEDLRLGGEGMKGFYDQILPAYLNEYGKKYGARVGTYDMPVGEKMVPDNAGLGMIRSGEQEIVPFHSFDITPQMREDIVGRGVPLYQVAPVGIGAAAAQQEEPPEPMKRGGKVRVGMDAMRMAVMRKADGGSVWPEQMAARIFVNQKRVAGAPEPASVWQQQLQQGYTPHAETMSPEQANMSIQELLRAPTAPGMAAGGIVSAAQKAARAFVEARKSKGMPEHHEAWQKALQRGETPPAAPASQEELTEEAKRLLETPKYKEMARGGAIGSTSNSKKKKKINIDAMRMAVADKKLKGKKHG